LSAGFAARISRSSIGIYRSFYDWPGPWSAVNIESITREATADAGTLYVPAARAACTAATLSARTPSPEAACETSLAALEKVARSLSKLLGAADVLPLP
jgi:hypothetical protein